jgi:plastocyanin
MGSKVSRLCAAIVFASCARVQAATLSAEITDEDGHTVANAVVMLVPDGREVSAASRLGSDKVIDQRDETFLPLVTIIPRGGRVSFSNNDPTMHQVYSFSPIRQFEFTLAQKQKSPPVTFDKAGVAAIGCNIHDEMIAYVFVSDSPWSALTGPDGKVAFNDLPEGNYRAQIWHPRLVPGTPPPAARIAVSAQPAGLKIRIRVLPDRTGHRRHGGGY